VGRKNVNVSAAEPPKQEVLIVSGLSGAGHSTTLRALEDFGYEVIDNLPLPLLDALLSEKQPYAAPKVAIGIDSRTRGLASNDAILRLRTLKARSDIRARILFLNCDDTVLHRRFQVARRPHPLHQFTALGEAISAERHVLQSLEQEADIRVNTSSLTPSDLKQVLAGIVLPQQHKLPVVQVVSFSYRRGLPSTADIVFDVRFLQNPYYDLALRPLTGRDPRVAAYIEQDPQYAGFEAALQSFLTTSMAGYGREGRPYLTVACGCTGGQHRSVFVAIRLAAWLRQQGWTVGLQHREGESL
jgi:RNase adapter protein RapZ